MEREQKIVHVWIRDEAGNPVESIMPADHCEVPWSCERTIYYKNGFEHHVMEVSDQGDLAFRKLGQYWDYRNDPELSYPYDVLQQIKNSYKPSYTTENREFKNGNKRLIVRCGICGQEMTPDRGLRRGKSGDGKRYYKCVSTACNNYVGIDVEVEYLPKYLYVPDYAEILTGLATRVYSQLEALYEASNAEWKPPTPLPPARWYDTLERRITRLSCLYDIRDVQEVDELVDEAIEQALNEEEKRDMLRALFYAAYGQSSNKRSMQAFEISHSTKSRIDFNYEHYNGDNDPGLIEYVPHVKLSKKQ